MKKWMREIEASLSLLKLLAELGIDNAVIALENYKNQITEKEKAQLAKAKKFKSK